MRDDRTFHGYGLDDTQIAELCRWALDWACDIRARRKGTGPDRDLSGPDWDAYLDE